MKTDAVNIDYEDGQVIVHQGGFCGRLYVVQEGQIEIVYEEEGESLRQSVLGQGAFFGEVPFLDRVRSPGRSRVTVRAIGPVKVSSVTQETIHQRLQDDPPLALSLVQTMSRRMRELEEEMISMIVGA